MTDDSDPRETAANGGTHGDGPHSRGVNTATTGVPKQKQSDEFLSAKGPTLDSSSSSSFYSHTSTTRFHDSTGDTAASSGAWRRPTGGASRPAPLSSFLHGDFESLETRLQKALESPTLQVS